MTLAVKVLNYPYLGEFISKPPKLTDKDIEKLIEIMSDLFARKGDGMPTRYFADKYEISMKKANQLLRELEREEFIAFDGAQFGTHFLEGEDHNEHMKHNYWFFF